MQDKDLLTVEPDRQIFSEVLASRKNLLVKWIERYRLLDARVPAVLEDPMWEEESQLAYLETLAQSDESHWAEHIRPNFELSSVGEEARVDVLIRGYRLKKDNPPLDLSVLGCIMVLNCGETAAGFLKKIESYKPALVSTFGNSARINWLVVTRRPLDDKNLLWQRGIPLHVLGES